MSPQPRPPWWQPFARRHYDRQPQWWKDSPPIVVPVHERCIRSTSPDGWPRCGQCAGCTTHSDRVMAEIAAEKESR